MIYIQRGMIRRLFAKYVLIAWLLAGGKNLYSQKDNREKDQMFTIYAGPGIAVPIGSFNTSSKIKNDFKAHTGFSYRGGFEWYFDYENCISLDGDINIFPYCANGPLLEEINSKLTSPGKNYVANSGSSDMDIFNYCVGYSRVIAVDNFLLQPKLNVGVTNVDYSFNAAFVSVGSTGGVQTGSYTMPSQVSYSTREDQFFNVKPEISIKYAKLNDDKIKWMLGFTVGYFYAKPHVSVYEYSNGTEAFFKNLSGPINCVTANVTFTWAVRQEFFRNIFRARPSFFFF